MKSEKWMKEWGEILKWIKGNSHEFKKGAKFEYLIKHSFIAGLKIQKKYKWLKDDEVLVNCLDWDGDKLRGSYYGKKNVFEVGKEELKGAGIIE